jgi:thiamine-phosphate pyrophosphorylase
LERRQYCCAEDSVADQFQLHLITDRKRCAGDVAEAVRRALAGGVDWVQVREKSAPALETYSLAQRVREACREAGGGLIVNDRIDIALAIGADGVHLGKKSLPPAVVRPLLAPGQLLGASVHSPEEAARAVRAGADYVTFGNVFATDSHPGAPAKGVLVLRTIVEMLDVPVLAIGGITPENVSDVLATGCAGVAVIGAILAAADPAAAAARLRDALHRSAFQPRHPFSDKAERGQTPLRQHEQASPR